MQTVMTPKMFGAIEVRISLRTIEDSFVLMTNGVAMLTLDTIILPTIVIPKTDMHSVSFCKMDLSIILLNTFLPNEYPCEKVK